MARYTDIFTELVRLQIELWNDLDAHLESHVGISLAQFQALSAIRAADGGARVQDISDELVITVGASSKVVDRLERDGLAVRSANPNDRRSSIVSLSESGTRALEAADEASEKHLQQLIGAELPEASAGELYRQLTLLRATTRKVVLP